MSAGEDDTHAAPLSDRYDPRSPSNMHVAGEMFSRWSDQSIIRIASIVKCYAVLIHLGITPVTAGKLCYAMFERSLKIGSDVVVDGVRELAGKELKLADRSLMLGRCLRRRLATI